MPSLFFEVVEGHPSKVDGTFPWMVAKEAAPELYELLIKQLKP